MRVEVGDKVYIPNLPEALRSLQRIPVDAEVKYSSLRAVLEEIRQYQQEPVKNTTGTIRMQEIRRKVERNIYERCFIPADLLPGESSTEDILKDLGEKEDKDVEMSLNTKKIKNVTIECEDGSTYEGKVRHIMGCPYDVSSQEITVKISKTKSGTYGIEKVIFQNPATIVFWTDGTKTVVNCMDNVEEIVKETTKIIDGEEVTVKKKVRKPRKSKTFNPEIGLAMAIVKKHFGNLGNYNNVFRKYIPEIVEGRKTDKNNEEKAEERLWK